MFDLNCSLPSLSAYQAVANLNFVCLEKLSYSTLFSATVTFLFYLISFYLKLNSLYMQFEYFLTLANKFRMSSMALTSWAFHVIVQNLTSSAATQYQQIRFLLLIVILNSACEFSSIMMRFHTFSLVLYKIFSLDSPKVFLDEI